MGTSRFLIALPLLWLTAALSAAQAPATPPAGPTVLKDADGKAIITYICHPPTKPSSDGRLGLWVTCHGKDGDAAQQMGPAEAGLERAKLRDDYVVIGVKSQDAGWTDADIQPVRKLIEWALKTYPIDPRRVYTLGCSSGSWFTGRFAPMNSDLVAGGVIYASGQYGVNKVANPELKAELYWVVGQKDTIWEGAHKAMEAFVGMGYRCVYREDRNMAHECGKNPTFDEAVQWLRALRNKSLPLPKADAEFMTKFSDQEKPEKLAALMASPATWQKLMEIGGPQAAAPVLAALASDKEQLRGNAAIACSKVMFNAEVVAALVPLIDDKSARLRATAITALTAQASWNYYAAHDALCAFIADTKKPAAERRAAVQGIGQVAKLDLRGGYQSKRIIWTLVDCLGDDDLGVRTLAYEALLLPTETGGFGYDPALTKVTRVASLDKWVAWAKKSCGEKKAEWEVAVVAKPVEAAAK